MSRSYKWCIGHHIPLWVAAFYLVTAISLSSFAAARDADITQILGNWHGMYKHETQGRMAVGLTIKENDSSGSMEYLLHYGDPRSCLLTAKPTGVEGDVYYFRFNEASGGFCDKLYKGEMYLQLDGKGNLDVTVQRKQIEETVKLHK